MPWTPINAATDVRAILGNLKTFFEANQVDALAWASPSRLLAPLTFYTTAEFLIKTDFPHWGIARRRVKAVEAEHAKVITLDLTTQFEVQATFTLATRTATLLQLQSDIDNYGYAIESMALNIPQASLFANITGAGHGEMVVETSDPLEVAVGDTKALFNVEQRMVLTFLAEAQTV